MSRPSHSQEVFGLTETGQWRPAGPTLSATARGVTPRSYSGAGLPSAVSTRYSCRRLTFSCEISAALEYSHHLDLVPSRKKSDNNRCAL